MIIKKNVASRLPSIDRIDIVQDDENYHSEYTC